MIKHLRIAALVAALAVPTVSLSGCGSVSADIIAARTVIGVIDMAISAVQNFSNAYFTQHPDAAKQAEIQQRIAEAQAAAAAGEALIDGGTAINSGDVAQAFGDFEAAYQDAVALAKDLGILTAPAGSRVGVEQVAGRLVVPNADDLLPKGVDLSTVHARSISVRASRKAASEQACRGIMKYDDAGKAMACGPDRDDPCVPLASCQAFSLRSRGAGNPAEPPGIQLPGVGTQQLVRGGNLWLGDRGEGENEIQLYTRRLRFDGASNLSPPDVSIVVGGGECYDPGTHDAVPAFPGMLCVKDGMTWADVAREIRRHCAAMDGCEFNASSGREPLEDAIVDSLLEWSHAKTRSTRKRYGMYLGGKTGAIHGYVANVDIGPVLPTWLEVPVALALGAATR